jgi:hypothetical protein
LDSWLKKLLAPGPCAAAALPPMDLLTAEEILAKHFDKVKLEQNR